MVDQKNESRKITIYILILLLVLFAARIGFGAYLWKRADGTFILLRGDDAGRVVVGLYASRYFIHFVIHSLVYDPTSPLVPLIYAQGLRICLNPFLIPPVINTIFGLAGILVLFFLTRNLFWPDTFTGNVSGLLSVGLAIFYPAFVWATLAGDRHSIFYFFVFSGLLLCISYIKKKRKILLLSTAIVFLLSTSTMHEGWIYTFVFAIFILKDAIIHYRNFRKIDFFSIICILIASLYILIRLLADYHTFGNPLGYMLRGRHVGSHPIPLLEKIITYPSLLAKMFIYPLLQLLWPRAFIRGYSVIVEKIIPPMFLVAMIWLVIKAKMMGRVIFNYTLFIIGILTVNVMLTIVGIDTVTFPEPRQLFVNLFCFIPLVSFGLYVFISKTVAKKGLIQLIIIAVIIGIISSVSVLASLHPPKSQMRKQAIQICMLLKSLWGQGEIGARDNVLLEQRREASNYSLFVEAYMIQALGFNIKYDRIWAPIINEDHTVSCDTKNNPSVFEKPSGYLREYLKENNIRVVIVHSPYVIEKVERMMEHVCIIGEYNIYVFPEDVKLIKDIRNRTKYLSSPWVGREDGEEPLG